MFIHPADGIEWHIFSKGNYESAVTSCFERLVQSGSTVLDIGAHTGYYTLMASMRVGIRGRVHAFEPTSDLFARLEANVQLNGLQNVVLNRVAVCNVEGEMRIYKASGENSGNSSIVKRADTEPAPVAVRATTIDGYVARNRLERVDLVKLDIEGAELLALKGGEKTLVQYQPDLICEVYPKLLSAAGSSVSELAGFLTSLGYKAFLISAVSELAYVYFSHSSGMGLPDWDHPGFRAD